MLELYLSSQSTREYSCASLTLLSLDKIISCCKQGTWANNDDKKRTSTIGNKQEQEGHLPS